MKKIIFTIAFLLSSILIFSQQNENIIEKSIGETALHNPPKPSLHFTSREVEKMVILKECKSVDENNKSELQLCLADEVKNRIMDRFPEFDEIADSLQLTETAVKIQFVLSKEGKIKDIKTFNFGSKELSAFIAKALEESKSEIIFEPALIKGEKVDLVFQLPVKYIRYRE